MSARLEALKEFLRAEPDDSFTRYALALEYIALKDPEQGCALLRETIERDPKYVAAYQQLAQLEHRMGRSGEAVSLYRRGIEAARGIRDFHAAGEMQAELDELMEEEL